MEGTLSVVVNKCMLPEQVRHAFFINEARGVPTYL